MMALPKKFQQTKALILAQSTKLQETKALIKAQSTMQNPKHYLPLKIKKKENKNTFKSNKTRNSKSKVWRKQLLATCFPVSAL
jgi:hypothetical protein